MKLQTRLNVVIFTIFFVGWMVIGLSSFVLEERNARQDSIHTAELLLGTAIATRDYTSKQIEPLLREQEIDTFIPETVPSYAAQTILARLTKNYEGYRYVERALNPTNPNDLAESWQVELIQYFIKNPDVSEKIGQRLNFNGQETLYVAKPIRVNSPSCLNCHSTPEVAPTSLIKSYGSAYGFNWKLNEVIGTRIVSVPKSLQHQQARRSLSSYLLLIASVFLVAYAAVLVIVQHWVTKPLNAITHLVEKISLHQVEGFQLVEKDFDSLGKLNRAINRLLISLNKALEAVKK
ncbi:MAG: DUF3365 domain-containing protein [Xenococcaceae cyanobacterium MO_234.B1]|nr:DUF3365 domain-containing protein [Xenococcaceae cyanobacterium MO_234.B1]